jgi:hypothetical protein
MTTDSIEVVRKLLANTTNETVIHDLVTPDATYISLNFSNPNLKRIMPWCGTWPGAGPNQILETFRNVGAHWENLDFTIQGIFGSDGDVAVFGSMKYRSRVMDITKTSPFAIWCKVNTEGKVTFMQFMEDTFATASTFEAAGQKTYRADPDGHEVTM